MQGELHITILRCHNLPIMDKKRQTTDAFVQIIQKNKVLLTTKTVKNSLDPEWKEPYTSACSLKDLVDDPFVIKIFDDRLGSSKSIGVLPLDLSLIIRRLPESKMKDHKISGSFPIYDCHEGIRGSIEIEVSIESLSEADEKIISFYHSSELYLKPEIYNKMEDIDEFVEELVVDTDPEYKNDWGNYMNTSRYTNEKRQLTMYKLTCELKNNISMRALKMNCDIVLGYRQQFDVEGDSGLVLRGYGNLWKVGCDKTFSLDDYSTTDDRNIQLFPSTNSITSEKDQINNNNSLKFEPSVYIPVDINDISLKSCNCSSTTAYQYCGLVSCRSIKYLGKLQSDEEDVETRDEWWHEVRQNLRLTAMQLHGNSINGYKENASIRRDVCIMSVYGTAVHEMPSFPYPCSCYHVAQDFLNTFPYNSMNLSKCKLCKIAYVPEVLISTMEPPNEFSTSNASCLIMVNSILQFEDESDREELAKDLTRHIVSIESELYSKLLFQLSLYQKNAVFKYKCDIQLGDGILIGVITGTGVLLTALPDPKPLSIRFIENYEKYNSKLEELTNYYKNYKNPETCLYAIDDNALISTSKSINTPFSRVKSNYSKAPDTEEKDDDDETQKIPYYRKDYFKMNEESIIQMIDQAEMQRKYNYCHICTTQTCPGIKCILNNGKHITTMNSINFTPSNINNEFNKSFQELLQKIRFTTTPKQQCRYVLGFDLNFRLVSNHQMLIYCSASEMKPFCDCDKYTTTTTTTKPTESLSISPLSYVLTPSPEEVDVADIAININRNEFKIKKSKFLNDIKDDNVYLYQSTKNSNREVLEYYGCINIHLIREAKSIQVDKLSSFYHQFLHEVNQIVKAHVLAVGGNAVICYQILMTDSGNVANLESQEYIVVNVSGDIVKLSESKDLMKYFQIDDENDNRCVELDK